MMRHGRKKRKRDDGEGAPADLPPNPSCRGKATPAGDKDSQRSARGQPPSFGSLPGSTAGFFAHKMLFVSWVIHQCIVLRKKWLVEGEKRRVF
jgi:hypothetical protein